MGSRELRFFATIAFGCLVSTQLPAEEASPPALTYSPWTKFCLNDTCFVGRDGRLDAACGPEVGAVFIERYADIKKTLRVSLPTRVSFERGVRIIIDQGKPIERPYVRCFANVCMADYDAGEELVDQLKQGTMLVLETVDKANAPIKLSLPLAGFASAYEGPPQEPKVTEEVLSEKEMQARLERQKSAEEDRKVRCQ